MWWILLALLVVVVLYPVTFWFLRVFTVAAGTALWLGAAALAWPRRPGVAAAILLAGALGAGWVCGLPGRPPATAPLREAYLTALLRYEGTRYLWGGENRLGIDCSGLVRKAMIDASVRTGLRTANPRLLRTAFDIWWHDCSARALRDEYRGFTVRRFPAGSINAIAVADLAPGDLAVTHDGVHVLACLGDRTWIEADPGPGRVVRVQTPTDNPWFAVPVQIVRWRPLDVFQRPPETAPPPAINNAPNTHF